MNARSPLVSVIILTWNRRDRLQQTLREVGRSTYHPLEVIVVDNASFDDTIAFVRKNYPDVRLLSLSRNIGVAGWNRGFAIAKGKYIVVLDDDSHPAPDAIERIVTSFESDPGLGIVACRVLQSKTKEVLNPLLNDSGFPEPDHAEIDNLRWMSFAGEGAGFRTAMVRSIGGYDEECFLYGNEEDFSTRALLASWDIRYFSSILFYHDKPARGRVSPRHCRFHLTNLSRWAQRYLPLGARVHFILGLHLMCRRYWWNRSVFPTWFEQLVLNVVRSLRPRTVLLHPVVAERYKPFCRSMYLSHRMFHLIKTFLTRF